MRGIRIISTGRAVPETGYDNVRMSEFVDTNDEWIRSRTGIQNRYLCREETCVSLATLAAGTAIERAADKDPMNKIGMVIVATTTPDYVFPSAACMVAKNLNLSREVLAFDLSAACSGFLYGLEMSRNYLAAHEDKYVMLIGAEQLSRIVDYTDRATCVLFGDGAGAVLLESADKAYVHHSGCDGNIEVLNCRGVGSTDMRLHMQGNAVFKFAVTVLQQMIENLLNEQNMTMEQIDCVICHQANARIIDHVKKKYPGSEHKFCMNLQRYGNTSAASMPILIDELFEGKQLQEGMKVICVGFGAGLTWGGTYMEI